MERPLIRSAAASDAEALARIYNHYIAHTIITFEEQAIGAAEMAGRVGEIASASLPWLVAERCGEVVGYAYASRWKGRCAYRFSVESTVYLDPAHTGTGLGTELYEALLARLRSASFRTAIGGIALPNCASVALHEKLGFQKVAHFRDVGFKFDRWIDVGYWQVLLDARPATREESA